MPSCIIFAFHYFLVGVFIIIFVIKLAVSSQFIYHFVFLCMTYVKICKLHSNQTVYVILGAIKNNVNCELLFFFWLVLLNKYLYICILATIDSALISAMRSLNRCWYSSSFKVGTVGTLPASCEYSLVLHPKYSTCPLINASKHG